MISLSIKRFSLALVTAATLLTFGCAPTAETEASKDTNASASSSAYPSKSVTIICPWSAGGGTDRLSRFMADQLQESFGKPFVVQNKTGGSGAVGHSAGVTAKADGHTLLMATFELSTMHWMGISKLTYENYDWVTQLNADAAAIIVKADAPWKNLNELIAHIKATPGKTSMSGTATGGAWDLARAGMLQAAGLPVSATIWAPTKGSAPAIVELLGGHVDVVCCSVPEAASQIDAGQLRVLAVMSEERLADYPDIPTCKESGVNWVAVGWRGLAVPKSTPENVLAALREKCATITASEAFKDFMKKNGFDITIRESSEFEKFLNAQDAQWKTVIDAAGYAR